jgi:hypothetical protein
VTTLERERRLEEEVSRERELTKLLERAVAAEER